MALNELHDRYHNHGRGSCMCRCAYCYDDEYCQPAPSVTGGSVGKSLLLLGAAGAAFNIGECVFVCICPVEFMQSLGNKTTQNSVWYFESHLLLWFNSQRICFDSWRYLTIYTSAYCNTSEYFPQHVHSVIDIRWVLRLWRANQNVEDHWEYIVSAAKTNYAVITSYRRGWWQSNIQISTICFVEQWNLKSTTFFLNSLVGVFWTLFSNPWIKILPIFADF